ncbi:MAG: 50S ribosomal protein L18 [Firmicutes bacterium]|nr:50S ribosomal protein L18 [Bacillota bacterium]
MIKKGSREEARQHRHRRVRKRVVGTPERPRLSVYRSNEHIYAQIIDDESSRTLCAASTIDRELRGKLASGSNVDAARAVGNLLAQRAVAKGISKVAFDRGGYLYHGRVAALAEAAREGGLDF